MASGMIDSSLGYHLQNAKANGVTKEEIAAIITPHCNVHRLAEGLGIVSYGKRSLECKRGSRSRTRGLLLCDKSS